MFFNLFNHTKTNLNQNTYNASPKKVILIILDGLGCSPEKQGNAFAEAITPNIDLLISQFPTKLLQTSGLSVGLPWKEVGNSEVGHLTIGTGQIIQQNLPKINETFKSGTFANNKTFLQSIENCRKNNSSFHLMGLYGSKGVIHSNHKHLHEILKILKNLNFKNPVYLHLFSDGRDSPQTDGLNHFEKLQNFLKTIGIGQIASVGGRSFGMDRNKNFLRTKEAYDSMVNPSYPNKTNNLSQYFQFCYNQNITDEYIKPVQIINNQGLPFGIIKENDSILFFNYRPDRAIQITESFILNSFNGFKRNQIPLFFSTMISYSDNLQCNVIIPAQKAKDCLTKIVSNNNKNILKIAETEKYAHVTYFFNGGKKKPFKNEKRILLPSRNIPFDRIPEMEAINITNKLVESIKSQSFDFTVVNFANPDMVGHTGNLKAAKKAIEIIDSCIGKIIDEALRYNYSTIITADHGNCDEMIDFQEGKVLTTHSSNPVFHITIDNDLRKTNIPTMQKQEILDFYGNKTPSGFLIDIAPQILSYLQLSRSNEMTGVISGDLTGELSRII